jgi:hypothetical protein
MGGWVDPRAGLDDLEKWEFLTLPGLQLRPLGRPTRRYTDCAQSQSHITTDNQSVSGFLDIEEYRSCIHIIVKI